MRSYHPSSERSWELSTNKTPATHAASFHSPSFAKAAPVVRHEIWRVGVTTTEMHEKSKEWPTGQKRCDDDESGGALCNRRVTVPERDKDVPSKHDPPRAFSWSNALQHRVCLPFEAVQERVSVLLGVSVMWGEWVLSLSAFPGCPCLGGLWVCKCCFSCLSWVQLHTCSLQYRHRAGQEFLSNWRFAPPLVQTVEHKDVNL